MIRDWITMSQCLLDPQRPPPCPPPQKATWRWQWTQPGEPILSQQVVITLSGIWISLFSCLPSVTGGGGTATVTRVTIAGHCRFLIFTDYVGSFTDLLIFFWSVLRIFTDFYLDLGCLKIRKNLYKSVKIRKSVHVSFEITLLIKNRAFSSGNITIY